MIDPNDINYDTCDQSLDFETLRRRYEVEGTLVGNRGKLRPAAHTMGYIRVDATEQQNHVDLNKALVATAGKERQEKHDVIQKWQAQLASLQADHSKFVYLSCQLTSPFSSPF